MLPCIGAQRATSNENIYTKGYFTSVGKLFSESKWPSMVWSSVLWKNHRQEHRSRDARKASISCTPRRGPRGAIIFSTTFKVFSKSTGCSNIETCSWPSQRQWHCAIREYSTWYYIHIAGWCDGWENNPFGLLGVSETFIEGATRYNGWRKRMRSVLEQDAAACEVYYRL
jgi:hypothetical protein